MFRNAGGAPIVQLGHHRFLDASVMSDTGSPEACATDHRPTSSRTYDLVP
jgi:hypothetical protein